MRSKILKTVGISFVLLVILIAGASLFTQTDYFRAELKSLLEKAVSEATRQTFSIGAVEGDLIRGIRLKKISLKIEGGDFLTVEEASARYSIPSLFDTNMLLTRTLGVGGISVKGLKVNLVKGKDGAWNFDKLGGDEKQNKPKSGSAWSVIIGSVRFEDARIRLDDRAKGETRELDMPKLDFSLKLIGISREILLDLNDAALSLSPDDLRIAGMSATLGYEGDKARIQDLILNLNGAEIRLNGSVKNFKNPEFDVKASVKGFKFSDAMINVETSARGIVRGMEDIEAEASVKLRNSEIRGERVSASIEKIRMDGSKIEIGEGAIRSGFGDLNIRGAADLSRILTKKAENRFNLKITARGADLSKIPNFPSKAAASIENADLDIEGAWREFKDFAAAVKINELGGQAGGGEFEVSGNIRTASRSAEFSLESRLAKLNPDAFLGDGRFKGSVNSNIAVKGSLNFGGDIAASLNASILAEVSPSTLSGVEIKSGNVDASYRDKAIAIKSLSIISDALTLNVRGDGRRMNFGYEAEVKNLGIVAKFFPEINLEGSLKASGRIRGSVEKPEFTLDGLIKNFAYKKEEIKATSIAVKADGVLGSGEINIRSSGEIKDARIQGRDVKSATFKAALRGDDITAKVSVKETDERALDAELTLSDFKKPEKSVQIAKVKLSLRETTIQNREPIRARISPARLILESFNLGYGESLITGEADVNFNGRATANLILNRLDLSDISEVLDFEKQLQGRASGNFTLEGDFAKPRIEARLLAEGVRFQEFTSDRANLSLNYADKKLTLKADISQGGRAIFTADGGADVDLNLKKLGENLPKAKFDLTVKSDGVDLSPAAKLNEEIRELRGIAAIDLRASGSVENPTASGLVKLTDASLKIYSLRNEIKLPAALFEMQGQKGFIRALEIESGGGRGTFTGDFDIKNLSYDVSGRLDNLEIKPKGITARLTGDVNLAGRDGKLNITGNAVVNRARIRIPEEAAKEIEDIRFTDGEGADDEFVIGDTRETDFFRDNVGMDLKISLPGNAWIRGRGANVEIQGNVGVAKRHENPLVITGNINTLRGTYEFLGKLFEIEEGRVTFQGAPEINPFLNVRALYEVSDVDIFVNIGGTAEKPEIKLTSDPAMEETDIFSYLVFGTSPDKLGAGDRVSLQQKAAETLGNMAIGQLKGIVGDKLSLDLIRVQSGEGGTEFEVGKYLTDDLFIAYERDADAKTAGSAAGGAGSVRVEYRLFDFMSLESQIGGERAGGDVFFKFDYSCSFLEGRK